MSSVFEKIVVAVDGTQPARAAADIAARLAKEFAAQLVFANAIDTQVVVDLEDLAKDESEALLSEAQRSAEAQGVHASAEVLIGGLAPSLSQFARETGADLIAMGTHSGRTLGRLLLGSQTSGVLRSAAVPVLVVHSPPAGEQGRAATFSHLFVACDDSAAAEAAIELAVRYAAATGAGVTFGSAIDSNAILRNAAVYGFDPAPIVEEARNAAARVLAGALDRAKRANVEAEDVVVEAEDVVSGIVDAAQEAGADLIVSGTHGRRGLSHLLLGSVAEGIVSNSHVAVLVTHAPHR